MTAKRIDRWSDDDAVELDLLEVALRDLRPHGACRTSPYKNCCCTTFNGDETCWQVASPSGRAGSSTLTSCGGPLHRPTQRTGAA